MNKILDELIIVVKVIGEMLFLYGLLGWTYGVLVQLTYPYWLRFPLPHLTPWLRVDTFTIISFIISALGFFMWRLTNARAQSQHKLFN